LMQLPMILFTASTGLFTTTILKRRTKNAQRHRQLSCHGSAYP
jgi:hypothetical protein